MIHLDDYAPITGITAIDDLRTLAGRLKGKILQHVNSTPSGGGVAEILNRLVPLLNELGIDTRWDFIKGDAAFFDVTKKFHNVLHGRADEVTDSDFGIFHDTSEQNIRDLAICGDIVFIHDPQPIELIRKKNETPGRKWIWRCHIDVSEPNEKVWEFLRKYIDQYDGIVFSSPLFSRELPVRQFLVAPSIDPLSDKNRELPEEVIQSVLDKYDIKRDKPIITQISRFDRLKDPVGVVKMFKMVRKYIDCRLILAGGLASDDPEGVEVYEEVKEVIKDTPDIQILLLPHSDIEVNALQRASTIIIQKSLREGFGLTVAEALWKSKPVVASAVGGIPLQITHKYSGLLCYSVEGAAFAVKQLLNSPDYAARLGVNGREHIKNNFLLTRHLKDYIMICLSLLNSGQDVVYL